MDPNAALAEIRRLVAEDPERVDPLTEQVAALDEWLSNGGFPPDAWLTDDDMRVTDVALGVVGPV